MKPEETIFDGISDSEMESISGGIAEVQSESQSESAAGDGYAVKCCNNKLKTKDEEKVKAGLTVMWLILMFVNNLILGEFAENEISPNIEL